MEDTGSCVDAPHPSSLSEEVPQRRIHSQADLDIFLGSRLCEQFISFASELSKSVQGLEVSPDRLENASPLIKGLVELIVELDSWIDEFPPLDQPMRFGNKAFRQWHARLVERAQSLLQEVFRKACVHEADSLAVELASYLHGAFGDATRIDYGTGHEASFFAILFILGARNVLAKSDAPDTILLVFARYIRTMYRLQTVYVLEPAGSHGVWGLDDFHALPFLFGSAQLDGMEDEVPTGTVYKDQTVRDYGDRFLYVGAVRQILLAKRGAPFHETSPMLYDISGVQTWQKIHNGLLRMYRAEVLGKLPVFQHFLFGPTIRWPGDLENAGAVPRSTPTSLNSTIQSSVPTMSPPGVACVAPWAKTPGTLPQSSASGYAGMACVAPWAKKT
mmetsp:Transcript_25979/g.41206  ORF Transcript_25979/g.41206 Transcript_25979/m.41206 type:complete len:389 (+) Transcript_25979:52-1218(+)